MEILLIKGSFYLERNIKLIFYGCYGTSLCLISLTSIIFVLNLDQFSSPIQCINYPRKKPSVTLFAVLTLLQAIKEMLIIILVCNSPFTNFALCITLQVFIMYFSMMYSAMVVALQLRAFRSVKYALQLRSVNKINWRYCSVVIIPTIITLIILVESYYHQNKWSVDMFNRVYVKCLLLLFSSATVLGCFFAAVGSTIIRISSLIQLNMSTKEMIERMKKAYRLRNSFALLILNIVFFTINVQYASTEDKSYYVNFVVVDSIAHVFLVSIFLLLSITFISGERKYAFNITPRS